MKTQRTIMKPALALAIVFLLAISVTPVLALNTINGDMISNPDSCYRDDFGFIICQYPHEDGIVGACTIDEHGVKHCPYPRLGGEW